MTSDTKSVISTIKELLKKRGLSYSRLAQISGISESTLKKSLAGEDLPLSRLHQICQAMGLSLTDFFEVVKLKADSTHEYFSEAQEEAFARDLFLYNVFNKIQRLHWSWEDLEKRYHAKILLPRLKRLEGFELIDLDVPAKKIFVRKTKPIRFRNGSKIERLLLKQGTRSFIEEVTEGPDSDNLFFRLSFSQLHPKTFELLKSKLSDFHKEFSTLSIRDRFSYHPSEVDAYTIVIGFGLHDTIEAISSGDMELEERPLPGMKQPLNTI